MSSALAFHLAQGVTKELTQVWPGQPFVRWRGSQPNLVGVVTRRGGSVTTLPLRFGLVAFPS